jgi:nitrogen fixation/metabolism regulation signal transduction histidine kinase
MERAALVRYATGVLPLAVLSVVLLGALFLMIVATESSTLLGPLYSLFLVISILGILLLLGLILVSLYRLAMQFRARVVGSRLTLRLLGIFTVLAVAPVAVVLIFSLQVVNRGIDTWFDVKTEQALDDALAVGRAALDASKKELLKDAKAIAVELEDNPGKLAVQALDFLRDKYAIAELTLLSQEGRIIASSSEAGPGATKLVPDRPSDAILTQVRQGQAYANLDAIHRGDLQLRVVVAVTPREVGAPLRILQVLQPLPTRYAELSQSVQAAFAEYQKLVYLRGPLKFGFTLTLGLVALLTVLIAASAAIFSARRLSAPIRDLAAGTRAVAQGDYGKQLPVQGKDEFGILVESFNDMTRKIREAQDQIKRSRAEAEMQHTYLQTVLTHLSSGVLSFNGRNCLRTHNAAAAQILRIDLEPLKGKSLMSIARTHTELSSFCEAVREAMEQGRDEWQTEAGLPGQGGRRTLIVRGTMLPGPRRRKGGYVLVFDDVTALIQAERDAAWREIARRLAHEIKNPLTPIQLSAERIRHKCMPALTDTEQRTLDRSTHTIIEQVEALKSMVNAFADYARPVYMQPAPMDLNTLIRDVIELHGVQVLDMATGATTPKRSRGARRRVKGTVPLTVQLDLDPRLPAIHADGGRLRQVLHNLLLNAREALVSQEVPTIRIHTHEVVNDYGASVQLTVEDNGPGIPDKLMDNLFEPYVTTREKGTGLGLAIVKRIVEEHNGTLAAENLRGGGARISITLPLADTISAGDDARRPMRVVASREKRA